MSVTRQAPRVEPSSQRPAVSTRPPERQKLLDRVLARAGQLPPLPHVAQKILSMTANPEQVSAIALNTMISTDQALTAQILKASNSAYFGLQREVTNLKQACTLLGFAKIRSMAMSFVADGVFSSAGQLGRQLWEHGVGVAVFARSLAVEVAPDEAEDAFIGGLLHDVGKILLLKADHEAFQLVLIEAADDAVMRLEAERENFGTDHTQLGCYLGEKWGFPKKLIRVIESHHEPAPPKIQSKFEAVVALANQACHRYGIGCPATVGIHLLGLPVFRMLGLSDRQLQRCVDRFDEEFKAMMEALGVARGR